MKRTLYNYMNVIIFKHITMKIKEDVILMLPVYEPNALLFLGDAHGFYS